VTKTIDLGKGLSSLERARDILSAPTHPKSVGTAEFDEFDQNEPVRIEQVTAKKGAEG
jgi:hypothetical protein